MQEATAVTELAEFLRFIGSLPEPDKVARALTLGPLGGFEATSALICLALSEGELNLVGSYGYPQEAIDRFRVMPVNIDLPLTRAFRRSESVVVPAPQLIEQYPVLSIDEPLLDDSVRQPTSSVHVAASPIVSEGVTCGVFGFVVDHEPSWGAGDHGILGGLGAALGLWATHPASNLIGNSRRFGEQIESPLLLRPRQVRILQMVEAGKSNAAIAAALGFSESTIKQEIQRMNRMFRSPDRATTASRARELGLLDEVAPAAS
jgi:DNA-binding CsgD family transcriptional regulator